MRNLTLIKCAPGHPMLMSPKSAYQGTSVSFARQEHKPVTVGRTRLGWELGAARVQVQNQTIDFPSIVSAPPHERRP